MTPPALVPWAVLAVVAYARGRISARTAGLATGVAVLLMGGVNAVAVIACLPLLVLAVVGAVPAGARLPIAAWTAVGVGAAVLWWLVPLLLLGRYSPPFLDFIETSEATTAPLGWANVARGAVHWVAFTSRGVGPSLPGAFDLHATALGVLLTWAVAIAALLGLTRPDMPYRRMLVGSFVLGPLALTIGHAGALESPLAGLVRALLDGPLAMLRNVHKIDPLVRLPLALGFGHAVVVVATARARGTAPAGWAERLPVRALVVVLAVLAVAPLALAPARSDGWREYPSTWSQAAEYIERHRPSGTTLVLPAAGFGEQTWGRTVDEPIQSVARTPWVSRSQVPLSPPQTIRFLDALTARTEDPGGSASLADVLARAGVRTIVVRHDLVREAVDPEVTRRLEQALGAAPGISHEATLGTDDAARVAVYGVDRQAPAVDAVETRSLAWVRGGAEDVVAAVEAGTLDPGRPAVMVGDAGPLAQGRDGAPPDIVGDGLARRERAFGLVRESVGPVLGPDEPFTTTRPVHDYPGTPDTPLAVAEYDGIAGVEASSSTASAQTVGPVRPDQGAWAGVDGDVGTAWRSDVYSSPLDQWWELDLGGPRPVTSVAVLAGVNPFEGVPIRRLVVSTDDGQSVAVGVHPETGEATARLSGAAVSRVRVTVDAVAGDWVRGSVGLAEVGIPGVHATRRVVVPPAAAGADTAFVFRTAPSRRACAIVSDLPSCAYDAVRGQEEGGGLGRGFSVDEEITAEVSAEVRAVAGSSTAALFDPLGDALQRSRRLGLRRRPGRRRRLRDGRRPPLALAGPAAREVGHAHPLLRPAGDRLRGVRARYPGRRHAADDSCGEQRHGLPRGGAPGGCGDVPAVAGDRVHRAPRCRPRCRPRRAVGGRRAGGHGAGGQGLPARPRQRHRRPVRARAPARHRRPSPRHAGRRNPAGRAGRPARWQRRCATDRSVSDPATTCSHGVPATASR